MLNHLLTRLILASVFIVSFGQIALAAPFNPVTDTCWSCMFPMTLASGTFGDRGSKPAANTVAPVCKCTGTSGVRVGVTASFYETSRIIESVVNAYSFPSLGTTLSNPEPGMSSGVSAGSNEDDAEKSFQQSHYYVFPVWAMLQLFTDLPCTEQGAFDLGYMSEADPLWNDDIQSMMINPEALIFGNPATQMSCAADAIAATVGYPLDPMFWCLGSWGSSYPLTGASSEASPLNSSPMTAARQIFRMGRTGQLWDTGLDACSSRGVLTPIMVKSNYKFQIARPVRGSQCIPIGRPSILWGSGKNPAYGAGGNKEGDFMFIVSRKRICCVGYNVTSQ